MTPQLTTCELAVLEALGRGGWVDTETLNSLAAPASRQHDHAAPRKAQTVRVHVFGIREKLGDGAVISSLGLGYMLGEPGAAYLRAARQAKAAFEAAP